MSQEEPFINGELLRLRREARGWVLNDMATHACMSVKQIRQLEEGGTSSFYSVAVKVTAAKKVGALLGLSADEVLAKDVDPVIVEEAADAEALIAEVVADSPSASSTEDAVAAQVDPMPEQIQAVAESSTPSDSKGGSSNSKNTLWLIAAVSGIALAVGAYFQPKEEPVVEPAPPIQVLPADAVDPASAASAADAPASTADAMAPAASAARVVVPVPSVPAASKAP